MPFTRQQRSDHWPERDGRPVLALLKEAGAVLHGLRGFACPTIIALCHPARNVTDDNLLSRGGGVELGKTPGLADRATRASCIERPRAQGSRVRQGRPKGRKS